MHPYQRVAVVLIKPTHYDDAGFPYRYWRGVLPSNSLAAMNTLTRTSLARLLPDSIPFEVYTLEDGIHRQARQLQRLARRFPEPGTKLLVGLVAVQTAQFPRACDLIAQWQRLGATCAMGGFHVSGSISTLLDGIHDATRKDVPCPKTMPRYLGQEVWRHLRYVLRLVSEFYRFQQVVFEAEFAPILAEKRDDIGNHLQSLRGWTRLTFGRAVSRQWLNGFWAEYGWRWYQLWRPRNYRWHLRVPLYALTELVYTFRFVAMLPRIVRTSDAR